jgi:hypothetical protein
MTLKSYLLLSGGGLLATYLVTAQPPVSPAPRATPARPESALGTAGADIREQADRLEQRVRAEIEYQAPSRNLFRFGARQDPSSDPAPQPENTEPQPLPPPVDVPLPPPPITLSGVATGEAGRTAFLVTVQGMISVREGDSVPPDYRVGRIEEDAIELTAADGTTRRILLRP